LRRLSRIVRGVPLAQVIVVTRAYVGKVALYGAKVWKRLCKP